MISRREFIVTALAAAGASTGLTSCSSESSAGSYETVADRTWRHGKVAVGDKAALMHELVRYATLAPLAIILNAGNSALRWRHLDTAGSFTPVSRC